MKPKSTVIALSILYLLLVSASVGYSQLACTEAYGNGPNKFSLATGSPGELGLLKVLGEEFAKKNNTTLCWVKAGSGEAPTRRKWMPGKTPASSRPATGTS